MAQVASKIFKLADTNLAGVTAIRMTRGDADARMSHSEAIANELLSGPLDHTDLRVAAIRQRLLSREWPVEARIVPRLVPQIGVTHRLTPQRKVANTAFTSNKWAGSTVPGTWAHAVGIWRVPTVSMPSTPPGTDGGWDSSCWVGIDGTYGSNDVLQAGVQQSVGADGSTIYVAWYEWFAPTVNGSPKYIYQTNIENMPIGPGDEVFVGVHYLNGQGFVMFGNVDRGRYFSIQLAAPPGASFSGNSVEWIVEAPNTGEPGTSIPRFTPVSFIAAFGSDANGTFTADPNTGDTTDIVAFGRSLTQVTLKTDALRIDYLDTGFFRLPGAAVFDGQKQKIAAVSRKPDHLDLFVIGNDGHVWTSAWPDPARPGQWQWLPDWHPLPGQAVFDKNTQRVAAVARTGNNLDLFVIGNDGHVWSNAWPDPARPGQWLRDWFPLPGPAVFDKNTQHVAAVARTATNIDLFLIGNDGHVWTSAWPDPARPGQWQWLPDWHPLPGLAVFDKNTQRVAAVARTANNLDLFVIGNDGHVWSNAWPDPARPGQWLRDWFPLPGPAVFDKNTQHVAAVARTATNIDLFLIGNDGHVWTSAWPDPARPGQWQWLPDWHPLPGQAVFDKNTQRVAAVARTANNLDLFVIGNDGHVWSNAWPDSARPGQWLRDWFPLPGPAVFDKNTQHVAAVARTATNIDLFLIGFDNYAWSDFWNGRVGWN